jgi:hypothetical protein
MGCRRNAAQVFGSLSDVLRRQSRRVLQEQNIVAAALYSPRGSNSLCDLDVPRLGLLSPHGRASVFTSRTPSHLPGDASIAAADAPVADLNARYRRLEVAVPEVAGLAAGPPVDFIGSTESGPLLRLARTRPVALVERMVRRVSDSSHGVSRP